ncbi:Flp family type IVb pilin [Pseudomonas inefficax]
MQTPLPGKKNNVLSEVSEMNLQTIKTSVMKFVEDENGLTVVEYAIAGGLVAATLITAFTNLGAAVKVKINALITALGGTTA